MLTRIAELALRAPKRVLALAGLLLVLGAVFGAPVADHLSSGGFTDPNADSTKATNLIDANFHGGQPNLVFLVGGPKGAQDPDALATARTIAATLGTHPDWLTFVQSYSTAGPSLISKDGKYGMVVAHIRGNDNQIQQRAGTLADAADHPTGRASIDAGGAALAYHQVNDQTKKDLAVA